MKPKKLCMSLIDKSGENIEALSQCTLHVPMCPGKGEVGDLKLFKPFGKIFY